MTNANGYKTVTVYANGYSWDCEILDNGKYRFYDGADSFYYTVDAEWFGPDAIFETED